MATYQECDRCGKNDKGNQYVSIRTVTVRTASLAGEIGDIDVVKDLCLVCRGQLKDFFKVLPKPAETRIQPVQSKPDVMAESLVATKS